MVVTLLSFLAFNAVGHAGGNVALIVAVLVILGACRRN